jgi:hypothetical protein
MGSSDGYGGNEGGFGGLGIGNPGSYGGSQNNVTSPGYGRGYGNNGGMGGRALEYGVNALSTLTLPTMALNALTRVVTGKSWGGHVKALANDYMASGWDPVSATQKALENTPNISDNDRQSVLTEVNTAVSDYSNNPVWTEGSRGNINAMPNGMPSAYQQTVAGNDAGSVDPGYMGEAQGIIDMITGLAAPRAQTHSVGYGQNNQGSNALIDIASELFGGTAPHRQALLNNSQNFLQGNYDVSSLPQWLAGKNAAEQAYTSAQKDILAQLPTGGALQEALAGAATDKARTMTGLAGNIAQDELSWIRDYAGNTAPQISTQAASSAGNIQSALRSQDVNKYLGELNADVTQRGQDISQLTGLSGIMTGMRGQDINQAVAQAQIKAGQQAQDDAGKSSAMGGIGKGIGSAVGGMFGGK